MKKLFLSLLSLAMTMTMFAQSNPVRKMNLIYDGQVVYSRYVSLIDSIKFVWSDGSNNGDDITGGEVDSSKQLYVGVVAFNKDVRQMSISSDMEAVKTFINAQNNDKDFTAFAYSVSKGNLQFDAADLPKFDNIFMLNFSDGTDNYSNMAWGEEGRMVAPNLVYDTARYDLLQRPGLNSYAIGFGNDVGFGEKMKKVVTGYGGYYNAKSANDLQPTFNEIAKSMLASAKNVLLKTNPGYYSGYYKYFRFTFTAEGGYSDVIYAKMDGLPSTGYTLSISKIENGYAYFDAPAKGIVDDETGKVHIPLNNLKFVKDGKELQYKFTIEVSFDGELYYEDVEEASTAEEISKRIAVVLVLDCSTSMGDAFEPMKAAAIEFIKTMEKMEVDDSDPNIPDPNPNTGSTQTFTVNGVSFTMVGVEGGTFTMGATSEQGSDPWDDEYPTHSVTLSSFSIGETEVTQELWKAVMGSNPSYFSGTNLPVEYVSWNDCQTFITKLNQLTGKNFRLPTEAEWEYAARGGNKSKGYKYAGSNTLSDVAWYTDNSSSKTHPVKQKQANELGLYDMSGNVWEWCQDWYGSYSSSSQTNPTGPAAGSYRVGRGGGWFSHAGRCRVSIRSSSTPTSCNDFLGLRLAL